MSKRLILAFSITGGIIGACGLLGLLYLKAKRNGYFNVDFDYSEDKISSSTCGNNENK